MVEVEGDFDVQIVSQERSYLLYHPVFSEIRGDRLFIRAKNGRYSFDLDQIESVEITQSDDEATLGVLISTAVILVVTIVAVSASQSK